MQSARAFIVGHWRLFVTVAAVLVTVRLIVPCPLRGNWIGAETAHLCDDHAFLRFSDGIAANHHGDLDPGYDGFYEKIGWNAYSLRAVRSSPYSNIIHVGWIFMRMKGAGEERCWWFHRDLKLLEGMRIVSASKSNALRAKERITSVVPGMTTTQVWDALGFPEDSNRGPRMPLYVKRPISSFDYMLYPRVLLHCDWDTSSNSAVLLKAYLMDWPEEQTPKKPLHSTPR